MHRWRRWWRKAEAGDSFPADERVRAMADFFSLLLVFFMFIFRESEGGVR